MKRFAEVNARTNTHNSVVGRSVQSIKQYDEPKSRPSEQSKPTESVAYLDALEAYNEDGGNTLE